MIYDSKTFKTSIYMHLARVGKALSSPGRLHIIDVLCEGSKTVEGISKETGMSFANTSQHLQILLEAHLVEFEKKGIYSYYQLSDPLVVQMFKSMQILGENLIADIQKLVEDVYGKDGGIIQVGTDELVKRVQSGRVTLIDVRSREEYEKGHLAGANSVPLEELKENLTKLPEDKEIIAYCKGRYCLLSAEAVAILKEHGYQAIRLLDNYPISNEALNRN